jgi:hypothetical protein
MFSSEAKEYNAKQWNVQPGSISGIVADNDQIIRKL